MAGLHDMAKMTVSGTPGTGTITLLAAVAGFQTFAAAGVANAEVISYSIQDGGNWEVGRGTYTSSGTTLTRGSLFSSSGGAAISLTSAATVWVSFLAEDLVPGAPATGLTATGTTQGTGLVLTAKYNLIGTVTATNLAAVLPVPVPGDYHTIVAVQGAGVATSLSLFPSSGVAIDQLGNNNAISIVPGGTGLFYPFSATQWISK